MYSRFKICQRTRMCISNSGFGDKLKLMNINKGKCLTEKLVVFNPLLLIHLTVGNTIEGHSKQISLLSLNER